jgi:hypothetical protein
MRHHLPVGLAFLGVAVVLSAPTKRAEAACSPARDCGWMDDYKIPHTLWPDDHYHAGEYSGLPYVGEGGPFALVNYHSYVEENHGCSVHAECVEDQCGGGHGEG